MSRTIIIDGDVVIYKVAESVSDTFDVGAQEDEDFIYRTISWANKHQAEEKMIDMLQKIMKDCKGQDIVICLSDKGDNFRKTINPAYKSNRKAIKPLLYDYLRNYVKGLGHKVYIKESLEADDVIGILATSKTIIKGDKVVWSLDKDFKTIPCKFHRAKPNGKDESHLITQEAADWWFMYQTLIGDKVDGYEGCKGIGDKTARKLLGNIGEKPIKELWKIVLDTYLTHGYTEEDALRNARMARILRAEDYDFKTKQVRLWQMK